MQKPLLIMIMLFSPLMTKASPENSFFGEHARGWHWYEVLPVIEEPLDPEEKKAEDQKVSGLQTPTELIKAYREALESRLHTAWVYPTPQNIKAYQEMQEDLMKRSKTFATVWMQNIFKNPELDHTLISPVNQQGRHLQIDLEKNRTFKVMKVLSETFGLFFFFSGDCPYCHQFAPIVKKFAETYGWEVIAISVDAGAPGRGSLAEFPNTQPDNGLFQAWNIKVLPSLFAVNPKTQEAIPIAYGLTSLDDMENRIMALVPEALVSPTLLAPTPKGGSHE
jgi:conjugal transfer pilus assembly protein TraF